MPEFCTAINRFTGSFVKPCPMSDVLKCCTFDDMDVVKVTITWRHVRVKSTSQINNTFD